MPVHNILSDEDFSQALIENRIVIIDFFTTQSEACKTLAPIFVEQANREDHKGVLFSKIDVNELKPLAAKLGVTKVPTFLVFKDGERVGECVKPGTQALLKFIGNIG